MMSKDFNYRRMINSSRWLLLRKQKLSSNPLCQDCESEGKIVAASEVHHVIPCESAKSVMEMEKLMYDYNNLRSLCHDCHVMTHKRMSSHSKKNVMDNVKANVRRFVSRYFE